MSIVLNGTTGITTPTYGGAVAAEYIAPVTSMKNRLINGSMVIDQRNAGASVTPTTFSYTLDRWSANLSQSGKYSVQQNAGSVTPPAGFTNYLGITSLAATSVGASDFFFVEQRIEGFNTADLGWGTANAATVTLSFWVRSSLTGTFGGAIRNSGNNRSYPFSYTITAANTWEQKTVTIAGDTTGTWLTNNGLGVAVAFGLGIGSNFSNSAGAWAAGNFVSATGATSVVGTNGATFYLTGVQLEKGSNATSFDYRPYGTELQLCQRYFYKTDCLGAGTANTTSGFVAPILFLQPMRATPTVAAVAGTNWIISDNYNADNTASSPSIGATYSSSTTSWRGQLTGFAGALVVARWYSWIPNTSTSLISFSAEL